MTLDISGIPFHHQPRMEEDPPKLHPFIPPKSPFGPTLARSDRGGACPARAAMPSPKGHPDNQANNSPLVGRGRAGQPDNQANNSPPVGRGRAGSLTIRQITDSGCLCVILYLSYYPATCGPKGRGSLAPRIVLWTLTLGRTARD